MVQIIRVTTIVLFAMCYRPHLAIILSLIPTPLTGDRPPVVLRPPRAPLLSRPPTQRARPLAAIPLQHQLPHSVARRRATRSRRSDTTRRPQSRWTDGGQRWKRRNSEVLEVFSCRFPESKREPGSESVSPGTEHAQVHQIEDVCFVGD